MENNFEYNAGEDILYIYNTTEPFPITGSIVCNNLIFDVASSGEVIGMQVENASKYLGTSPENLERIKEAKIRVMTNQGAIVIGWKISAEGINSINTFMLPKNKIALNC